MMWSDFMRAAITELELEERDFVAPAPLPTTAVPDVIGRRSDRATATLERFGFVVEARETRHWRESGRVAASDPAPGAAAPRGSVVQLEVSDGRAPAPTVPDVVGRGVADAERLLADVGLRVKVSTVPVANPERYETVMAQSPAAGSPAVAGLRSRLVTVALQVGRPVRAGEVPRTFSAALPNGR
jgi:serine/threonine-protein kinase